MLKDCITKAAEMDIPEKHQLSKATCLCTNTVTGGLNDMAVDIQCRL